MTDRLVTQRLGDRTHVSTYLMVVGSVLEVNISALEQL